VHQFDTKVMVSDSFRLHDRILYSVYANSVFDWKYA